MTSRPMNGTRRLSITREPGGGVASVLCSIYICLVVGSSSMHSGRRIYVGLLRVYNITMTGILKYFPKTMDAFLNGPEFLPLAWAWNTAL